MAMRRIETPAAVSLGKVCGLAAAALLSGAVIVNGCGGSSPASPSPPPSTPPVVTPPPTPPTPPVNRELWAVSGRVVSNAGGAAVSGVRVTSQVGPTTTTAADGSFRLGSETNPPFNRHLFTLEHQSYVPRELYLNWQSGQRENVTLDMIPLAAPFSAPFYKQLVRNTHDDPSKLEPLRRWTTNPSFYVRNADQTGRPIEPEVMALVLATIPRAVTDWTGGRLSVAQLESGPETRPETTGWITVNITRDYSSAFCGQARVAGNPGLITLVNDRCNCGSVKIGGDVVVHEVGHALGFWHVGDRNAVMYPQASGSCPTGTLTANERYHAGIAYQRAPGNLDPDRDPSSTSYAVANDTAPPVVSCFVRGRT
jgi:hypothetical protein